MPKKPFSLILGAVAVIAIFGVLLLSAFAGAPGGSVNDLVYEDAANTVSSDAYRSVSKAAPLALLEFETELLYEDFESTAENAYPSTFTLQYNGSGTPNQKVITTDTFDGLTGKVFQLQGVSSWASEQYVSVPASLPENLVIDAYIMPVTSTRNAEIALRNLGVGTWGTRISSVWFEGDGTIVAVQNGNDNDRVVIGSYDVGSWYRVTLDNNITAKTYDVYIDGVLAEADIPMNPSVAPAQLSLIAHNVGFSAAYFDNVGMYTELPDFSTGSEPPSATNVAITGSAVVGETLTGGYDFNGTTESGTAFRWLKNSGTEQLITQIHSIAGVSNNPPNPSFITLSTDAYVTTVYTYHYYNYGQLPGTIALQEVGGDGTVYGPWDAVGVEGSGSPNAYWMVYPNITLPAGEYQVIDSHPPTWSWTDDTGGRGFVYVYGNPTYSGDYTPIDGAVAQTYTLTSAEAGYMIKFEVTPQDLSGVSGSPVLSAAVGPVEAQIFGNQAPVLSSDWSYSTVYFGQSYPFNVSVTDYENTPNTKLYSYIDSAVPSQMYNYAVVPGTVEITLSPLEGVLSAGSHTLNYYAVDADGATSETLVLNFTVASSPSDNAALSGISITGIDLTPVFDSETTNYTASVGNSIKTAAITAEPADDTASVTINGVAGSTGEVALNVGSNVITIEVTAADGVTTKTYTITIKRAARSSSGGGSSYNPPSVTVETGTNGLFTVNSIKVEPDVSSGIASVTITKNMAEALLEKAKATGGISDGDLIEVIIDTGAGIEGIKLSIPQSELARIASGTDAGFGISSPFIKIVFDGKAVETIAEADSGGDVVISANRIADLNGRPVYDLAVKNGGTQVNDFNGGHATVTIPYALQAGENPNAVVIYSLADSGALEAVRGYYDAELKAVVFKTTFFSEFVIGYNPVTFTDVAPGAWYKNAVDFIAARGITAGIDENKFGPEENITRAQFVVLLMNAFQINPQEQNGYKQAENFADAGNTYYTPYLQAARGMGIVKGVGSNMFAPGQEITRQEMLVILYNALKAIDELPAAINDKNLSAFNDDGQVAGWANEAVSSLIKSGIVEGDNNSLYPASTTTRAEFAQVLYNLLTR